MNESKAVAIQNQERAVARPEPSVGEMLSAVIEKGISNENVDALVKLTDLYERTESRRAEREFAEAFNLLQSETPSVKAMKPVPGKNGEPKYTFAPYEDIMAQVAPMLQKHGFTVTFSTDFKEGRIIKICTLQHTSGHSRTNTFAARIGHGPPGATESQADGAASTYAKRFALCDALNIVIDKDTDAKAEGAPITEEQAQELRLWVQETNTDEKKFLKFAGADKFENIMSNRYEDLCNQLRKKEGRRK